VVSLNDNPFAVLTAVVAPAILTSFLIENKK
jgi:uncharacterized membrane protein